MLLLPRRKLLRQIDQNTIQNAIQRAEQRTSGEIRVSIAPFFWGNIHRAARLAFHRLSMNATRERNGVLIFVVPARHRFVILGDEGIHSRVGQNFWEDVAAAMSGHFRQGAFTEGIVLGIEQAGEQLAAHFPCDVKRDVNELPNDVDFGKGGGETVGE